MAMIQTRALTKRYGGIVAVDDLSFDVPPGKVTALLGPNGAGKTTTLRLMLDLERGGGETRYDGRRYRRLHRPGTVVGACLGPGAAHPGRRVRAHLRMLAAAGRIPARRVDEVLDLVGLTPVAGARARVLSAGALGRLALASALLGDPDTLILDEPAAGLDPQGVRWLRDFLRAYAAQGRTVLVAGHILAETARCADRVLVISRGRLVADESAADFLRRGVRTGVAVRTPQVARLSALLRAEGVHTTRPGGTTLTAIGADRARVGEIAFRGGVLLHELTEREPGVGDAFADAITRRRERAAVTTELARTEHRAAHPPEHPADAVCTETGHRAEPTRVDRATRRLADPVQTDDSARTDDLAWTDAPVRSNPHPHDPAPALAPTPAPTPAPGSPAGHRVETTPTMTTTDHLTEALAESALARSAPRFDTPTRVDLPRAALAPDPRGAEPAPEAAPEVRPLDEPIVAVEPLAPEAPPAARPPRRRFARTWRSADRARQTDEVRSA
ncbi:ABC transporter ATP-binding protein [Embleya hyalina]|uniref:ABC transporter ATP-binding protein n=1 Tax=Embleya hyalina TaxID=516124 RepID=A0A401YZB1_9ACTN|nr:ATP-binding cassette domain-containing protein [Embleya hyalina]GCD99956.1 ABC transporter ATP-binding protein [Embleya hyalina]